MKRRTRVNNYGVYRLDAVYAGVEPVTRQCHRAERLSVGTTHIRLANTGAGHVRFGVIHIPRYVLVVLSQVLQSRPL